jgi:hypothetical protein
MNRKTIIVVSIALIIVLGILGYNYLYQDHRQITVEEPEAELNSDSITEIFKMDASNELLNATVSVTGVVTEIDQNSITLDGKVTCSFSEIPANINIGDSLEIKGRCIGYDDLFEIVKLDQCSILN